MVSGVKGKKSTTRHTRKQKTDRLTQGSLKNIMAAEQSMSKAIIKAAIEVTKGAIMAVREPDNLVNSVRPTPRSDSQVLRQPMFDWKAAHKYQEPCNFEIEVKNIFMTNNYSARVSERIPHSG